MAKEDTNPTDEVEGGSAFYVLDEHGQKQDAGIHDPLLENADADLVFCLEVIRDHVRDGASLEDAVALFGNEQATAALEDGSLTLETLAQALGDGE